MFWIYFVSGYTLLLSLLLQINGSFNVLREEIFNSSYHQWHSEVGDSQDITQDVFS